MKIQHLFLPLFALTANISAAPSIEKEDELADVSFGINTLSAINEDENITWRTARRLSWEDFMCEPQKQGDAVASTSTSLGISYQVKNDALSFDISCHFSKKKSWGLLKTDYILAHEQAHFDITELHARKLYQALYNYKFNPVSFKKDISVIYDRIVKEKEEMQAAYDGETDHSRRKRIQYEWLEKIDTMLAETEMFASYP